MAQVIPTHGAAPVATLRVVGESPMLHLSIPVADLDAARSFYVDGLGCRPGRERDDWFDVWFFGLQLTVQLRPNEVRAAHEQGVRHFGVVLRHASAFEDLVARVDAAGIRWLSPPKSHADPSLNGKVGGKLADPSGNVIEIKYYEDVAELLLQ